MDHPFLSSSLRAGTAGGFLLVLLVKVNFNDVATSALLAGVGAAVSFGVSALLRYLQKRFRRK